MAVVTKTAGEASIVLSQLKGIVRTTYSNPPAHGARLVAKVRADEALTAAWYDELASMRDHLKSSRELYISTLEKKGVMKSAPLLRGQSGLFSFTGVSAAVPHWLRAERSVYMVDNGRLCIAAITPENVEYVCDAIGEALRVVGQ